MSDIDVIDSVKALSMGPRDVLVVKLSEMVPARSRETIVGQIRGLLDSAGCANKVMVLDPTMSLEVLRVEAGA